MKMSKNKEYRDDEFRVLGPSSGSQKETGHKKPSRWLLAAMILVALLALIGAILLLTRNGRQEPPQEGVFENEPTIEQTAQNEQKAELKPFGSPTPDAFTQTKDTVINDIPLTLYIPHNAVPELFIGSTAALGKDVILAAQAADIRKDNKKILGAFVLKGEPLAWGLSKKGYCAIIDGNMTIGVSENSPLFEEATEKDGYFFRQYPLVDQGVLVENELKNKSVRKALCSRAGEFFIAATQTNESMHDFAQALVDLGVENAIYLVGGSSYGLYTTQDGEHILFNTASHPHKYKYENYIVWRKKS